MNGRGAMRVSRSGMLTASAMLVLLLSPATPRPVLTHNGSNSMNYATVPIDPQIDLAIVVTANYPGDRADQAVLQAAELLYKRYAGPAGNSE